MTHNLLGPVSDVANLSANIKMLMRIILTHEAYFKSLDNSIYEAEIGVLLPQLIEKLQLIKEIHEATKDN